MPTYHLMACFETKLTALVLLACIGKKKQKTIPIGIVLFYFNTGAKTIADVLCSWHNFMIPHIKEGIKKKKKKKVSYKTDSKLCQTSERHPFKICLNIKQQYKNFALIEL